MLNGGRRRTAWRPLGSWVAKAKLALPAAALLAFAAACTPAVECSPPAWLPADLAKSAPALPQGYDAKAIRELWRGGSDPHKRYLLGLIYEEGVGREPDRKMAAAFYYSAAKKAHSKAQFRLAYMLWEGVEWPSTNTERYEARDIFSFAAPQITALAKAGDAEAQYMLGYLYGTGKAFPIDRAEGEKWYRRAAAQGHAPAQYELGRMHKGGRNDAEALNWFRRSAENGYPLAQFHLGESYRWGVLGVAPDLVEAKRWYSLAASAGHAGAAYALEGVVKRMSRDELRAAERLVEHRC